MKPRVLVVEDEEAIAAGLRMNLEQKGYEVEVAADGHQALERAAKRDFDLVVLDVRLPGVDGFEVLRRLRAESDRTPILMLTARAQPDDVVFGLKAGADDYVVKPFDLAELLARVEGLLRRRAWAKEEGPAATSANGGGSRRTFGAYWVDLDTLEALTREGQVTLSAKETAVMRLFLSRPNQVVTRRELLAEVWQLPRHPNERVVDNVIVALRQAFEEDSSKPRHILSVRGVGYRFVP
jgi:two-component system alkaline phosphatase synthesis response regulator PhoP